MPDESIDKTIQDRLVGILEAAEEDLRVDSREVAVIREMPEDRHSQAGLPLIVVNRPTLSTDELRSDTRRRLEYTILIECIDGKGVSVVKEREGNERLHLLQSKVRAAIRAVRFLNMPEFCVFASLCTWDIEPEPSDFGNNLRRIRLILNLPLTVVN